MKIDRLVGILSVLLQRDKVTAPDLAERFEVSRRTISRDIEALCKAGIPIKTAQGKNGGISIMEGYKIDRTLLTSREMQAILTGLRSLDSISGTGACRRLMDKLSAGSGSVLTSTEHILIDLSSYYKASLAPKIEMIQDAIERHEKIRFTYFSPKGKSRREIEPYLLTFQWSSWYVWGYCPGRRGYRLFKLNRMVDAENTEESFSPRKTPDYAIRPETAFSRTIEVKVLFDAGVKWRLIEEFGMESFTETKDGKLLFQFGFADTENVFSWVLSFGEQAELLEPEQLRLELVRRIGKMLDRYK